MKRVTSNLKNEVKLNNGVREASESIFTVMKIAIDGYKNNNEEYSTNLQEELWYSNKL